MSLPIGWVETPLLDVTQLHDAKRIPLNQAERSAIPGEYPYFGANGQVDTVGDYLFDGDYILLAEDGGYFDDPNRNVAYEASGKFWVNNHAHILSPEAEIPLSFIGKILNTLDWMPFVSGTTRLKLTQGGMQRIKIPLPPLAEQCRIVTKLDALTARLARAQAELDRIPLLAKKMRSCAVRDGFSGRLTKVWRAANTEGGIDELASLLSDEQLPDSWSIPALGDIAEIKSGVTLGKQYPKDTQLIELPYLRVANVQRGNLNLSTIKFVSVTAKEAESIYLESGDILMNEGGDRDKLGRGWIWQGEIDRCIHQNHVFRVRLKDRSMNPKYVSYYANEFGQDFFIEHGTQTTNLASISKKKLSSFPIPLAPPDEQQEIVRLIENTFVRANRLETEAARAKKLLDRLESAILAKAFRGELVPQDPNDEPASALLARIRAQRAAASISKRRNKGVRSAP